MRYIDADLIKYVPLKIRVDSRCIESSDFLTTKKDIDAIPTADVEEVRHGEWKDGCCTNCGTPKFAITVIRGFDEVLYEYEGEANYCPNCGAKMNGGR